MHDPLMDRGAVEQAIWKLTKASALAVVASELVGGTTLAALTPSGALLDPIWWASGIVWWIVVSIIFVLSLGLMPGLLCHAMFKKLGWNSFAHYISLAALIFTIAAFFAWHFLRVRTPDYYWAILAASLSGTLTFWLIDRPDKLSNR